MVAYNHINQKVKVVATAFALPAANAPYAGRTGILERIRTRGGRRYCAVRIGGRLVENFLPEELVPAQLEALPEAA